MTGTTSAQTGLFAGAKIVEQSIEATIIRADGTREPLGTISYYHRNPIRRWLWRFGRLLKG